MKESRKREGKSDLSSLGHFYVRKPQSSLLTVKCINVQEESFHLPIYGGFLFTLEQCLIKGLTTNNVLHAIVRLHADLCLKCRTK